MDLSHVTPRIDILSGQPLRIENGIGRRYAVVAGHVWLTQDRDPRDQVFSAGDDFLLDREGLAVFSALDGNASIARLL